MVLPCKRKGINADNLAVLAAFVVVIGDLLALLAAIAAAKEDESDVFFQ